MRALAIAATGMNAQQTQCRGHRQQHRQHQHDRLQARARRVHRPALPGRAPAGRRRTAAARTPMPEGAQLGLGVRTAAIRNLHIQGPLARPATSSTSRSTAAAGSRSPAPTARRSTPAPAPSTPTPPASSSRSTATRRAGDHRPRRTPSTSSINEIGPGLSPRVDGADGAAAARPAHARQLRQRCRPRAARRQSLPRDAGLRRRRSPACPAIRASARIQQGYLEGSNVDPVKEITELISAQRAYEMNSKVIQAADEMAGTVSKGIR